MRASRPFVMMSWDFLPLMFGDEADAASVVLEARVVEALFLWAWKVGMLVGSVHVGRIILKWSATVIEDGFPPRIVVRGDVPSRE